MTDYTLDNRKTIWDSLCELKDVGTGTTGATGSAGLVDSSLKIWDSGDGRTAGMFVVNLGTAYLASPSISQAKYVFRLQGSDDSSFGTPIVNLARIEFGLSHATDPAVGLVPTSVRNVCTCPIMAHVPFENDFMGTVYRYLRVYAHTDGTVVTTFHYSAWLSK